MDPVTLEAGTISEYENGCKCSRCGVNALDMGRDDLIAYIGTLDFEVTRLNDLQMYGDG